MGLDLLPPECLLAIFSANKVFTKRSKLSSLPFYFVYSAFLYLFFKYTSRFLWTIASWIYLAIPKLAGLIYPLLIPVLVFLCYEGKRLF